MNIERDGHVHSPYCSHGSNDSFDKYITEAITKGIKEITVTEHLMFPKESDSNKAEDIAADFNKDL